MASQYSLNLKAVLDTTQVKQELQKLRQMQNQILGNNRGNSVNGGTSNSNNLGNINGLNSTLGRLTNSINQLNNAINKLNTFNQKSISTVQPQQNINVTGRNSLPFAPALGASGSNTYIESALNNFKAYRTDTINKGLQRFMDDPDFAKNFMENAIRARTPNRGRKAAYSMGASYLFDAFQHLDINEIETLYKESKRLRNDKNYKQFIEERNRKIAQANKKTGTIPKEVITGLGGMVVNQAGQDISQILAIQGYDTASQIVSWGSAIGGGAIAGGGIGAGIGAAGGGAGAGAGALIGGAIGGLVGALGKATDELQKCATEIADAAKTMQERIKAAAVVDTSFSTFKESLADKNALKKEDEQYFKDKIEKEKVNAKNAKAIIDSDVLGGKSLVEYEQETHKLEQAALDGLNDEEQLEVVRQRKTTANNYIKAVNDFMQSTSKIEQAQSTLDGIKEKQKAEAEREKQKAEAEREKVSGFNKIIDNEKLSITRYNEGNEIKDLIKTGDIESLKSIALKHSANRNSTFDLYQSTLNEAALATDSKTKEELLEKANKYKSDWQYSSNTFENLNQNLRQLLVAPIQDALSKLTAPNLDNVNSLASQGVMINRADDKSREQTMMDYSREQTDLQKKIKQILEEKSFESVIS